jgi:hypothetical protein
LSTFLDLFAFTKGIEYLIAIASIFGFIAFWFIIYGKGKGSRLKIALLGYLVLGFILMVGSCLATRPH